MSSLGASNDSDDAAETPETTTWSANGTHGEAASAVATAVEEGEAEAVDGTTADETAAEVTAEAPVGGETTAEATAAEDAIVAEAVSGDLPPTDEDGSGFLSELVRAMQTTATAEKARLSDDIERRRTAHLAAVETRRQSEATSMRELADADLKAIDAWAEDERTRIHDERERRAAALQADLETSLAEHGSMIDREVEAVEAAIAAHRTDVDAFFAKLERETDPVAIARHASKRPTFPALETIGTPASETTAATTETPGGEPDAAASDPATQAEADAPDSVGVMAPPGSDKLAESWAAWSGSPADAPENDATDSAPADAEGQGEAVPVPASVSPGNGKVLQSMPSSRPLSWLRRDHSADDRPGDDR